MIQERITSEAMQLFGQYGIKSVGMEQIASSLRISKKTIYENFESKEALLAACLWSESRRLFAQLAAEQESSTTAVEAIIFFFERIFSFYETFCPAFLREVVYYHDAHEIVKEVGDRLQERSKFYFDTGVTDGYFNPESDHSVLFSGFLQQTVGMKREFRRTVLLTLLRGISTPKGYLEIEKLVTRQNHSKNKQ